MPPEAWNWPHTNWESGVDSDPTYRYPYGGEEHRHEPAIDVLPLTPKDAAQVNPLARPVASWSEDDLRRLMASPAYLRPSEPGRARAHAMVREWFERAATTAPRRPDATGRQIRASTPDAAGGACEVPVREHSRERGKVHVDAHCRARPGA